MKKKYLHNNMSQIQEAPIVHGKISVASCDIGTEINFSDGSKVTAIENVLNSTSFNPITSGAVQTAINNINTPPVSNFFVELLMNSSSTHTGGTVQFSTLSNYTNSYVGGGANGSLDTVIVPVTGTYAISSSTKSFNSGNIVSTQLTSNSYPLLSSSAENLVMLSGTFFLNAADMISLLSSNQTVASSTLMITLLKAEQSVPLQQGAMLPRNNCMSVIEKYTCNSESSCTQLISDLNADVASQSTSVISYMVTSPSTTVVERHAVVLGASAINAFIFADVTRSGVSSYNFHYIVPENFTISNGSTIHSTISDIISVQSMNTQLASHHLSYSRTSVVNVHLTKSFTYRSI